MKNYIIIVLVLLPSICSAHIQEGLVGWWKFDETSGDAVDSSGQGNTGTPTGTTIISNCKRGACRSFNGSSDKITTAINSLSGLGSFSISVWVYSNTTTGDSVGLVQYWLNSDLQILIRGVGGNMQFYTFTSAQVGGTSSTYSANSWEHFVFTYDGTTMLTYKNGIVSGTTFNQSGTIRTSSNNVLRIGGSNGSSEHFMNGNIDDVRIYSRALTAVEIMDLYRPGTVINGAVLSGAKINQ